MSFSLYITSAGKRLRCGYTTGACAAAAAKAATFMLLSGEPVSSVTLTTPKGITLSLDITDTGTGSNWARCAVMKDAGDDPDVTDGFSVYARAEKIPEGVCIDGAEGIGRVTKPGLDQPVGAAAINSVPRRMITEAVSAVCEAQGYGGGIAVTLSIPGGETLARRTFNPRMGIEGGLSVIGTTGIVEPMSNQALIDTVRLELRQLAATGARAVLLTPGNYGAAFSRETLGLDTGASISCSNFIGDAIDAATNEGFDRILLVGHIGKLVKLGIGMTNTHSANGDGRMETFIACALEAGASLPLLRALSDCVTTDAAVDLLNGENLLLETMGILGTRIDVCLRRRIPATADIGYVCFTNQAGMGGVLARSPNAEEMIRLWRKP
jgi:cobalt-precorrin-5B (C1)-methyltransferase